MLEIKASFMEVQGLNIHFIEAGKGPTLVLLHGWPEFCQVWRRVLPKLAESFRVIAPDLRGFGKTRLLPGTTAAKVTPELLANDLVALLQELNEPRVGVVSHDVGANVAQVLARARPEMVAGLFFFNCPYPGIGQRWAQAGHLRETWYQYFHQLPWTAQWVGRDRVNCKTYISHFLRHWSGDPLAFSEDDLEEWTDNFMQTGVLQGGFDWYAGVDEMRSDLILHGPPSLPKIKAPARFLWGAKDPIIKIEWADRLEDYFSEVRFSPVPDAGHFVQWEKPTLAGAEIVGFFFAIGFAAGQSLG